MSTEINLLIDPGLFTVDFQWKAAHVFQSILSSNYFITKRGKAFSKTPFKNRPPGPSFNCTSGHSPYQKLPNGPQCGLYCVPDPWPQTNFHCRIDAYLTLSICSIQKCVGKSIQLKSIQLKSIQYIIFISLMNLLKNSF